MLLSDKDIVPYQRNNTAGVHPLSELNPDIRRFCEDSAPGLLPNCILCDRLSEFKNSPCEHVTYCVVHAIDGTRCNACNADITNYIPLVPYANRRRKKIQSRRDSSQSIWNPVVPYSDTTIHAGGMPTYMPLPPKPVIPVSKPPEPVAPNPPPKGESGAGGECGICYGNYSEVNKVLIDPCGHTCCRTCGENLKKYHICRQPVLKLINVFD